jgi:PhnB protein
MSKKVNPIPEGYRTVTPFLTVEDGRKQLDFLQRAFNAEVTYLMQDDEGRVQHAELTIGDSKVMVGQCQGEWKARPSTLYLYVEDTDAVYKRALEAGATSVREPTDQVYGDRNAGVEDSNGNQWWIGTHIEDVSHEEMERRMKESRG